MTAKRCVYKGCWVVCVCTSYVEVLPPAGLSPLALRRVRIITASHPERTVRDPEGVDGELSPQIGQCFSRWCQLKKCFCTLNTVFFMITSGVLVSSRASARLKACSASRPRRSVRAVWASCTKQLNSLHKLALPSSNFCF